VLSVLLATITQCKVASGSFVMLASAVHNVAKYNQKVLENTKYQRPKRSSNKIRILQTKFEFGKKNKFNIPIPDYLTTRRNTISCNIYTDMLSAVVSFSMAAATLHLAAAQLS